MPFDQHDRQFMERALTLAEKGRGMTSPNPCVGAVVVAGGRIVGEGYHIGVGKEHAEVVALQEAAGGQDRGLARGGTLYVTLEPCCHEGRTPPCVASVIASGLSRVVVGALDPSPRVNGKGVEQLRTAGIEVVWAEDDVAYRAKRQNDAFRKHVLHGLPFVTYKYAMTLDGRVSSESGHSRWISGEKSRARVHQMRSRSDVVMVGAGTARLDNPTLTAREKSVGRQPVRVVVDPALSLDLSSKLVRSVAEGRVVVLCSPGAGGSRRADLEAFGVEVMEVSKDDSGYPDPRHAARILAERDVQSVLLEGGPTLAAAWWDAGMIDRVVAFVAPVLIGGADSPGPLPGKGFEHMEVAQRLRDVEIVGRGTDVEISGYLEEPA